MTLLRTPRAQVTEPKPGIKLEGRTPADPQVGLIDQVRALLPTPAAGNFNDGETLESWEERRQRNLAKGVNGNGQGTPLAVAVQMLPTPQSRDGHHGRSADPDRYKGPKSQNGRRSNLDDMIAATRDGRWSGERMVPPSPATPPSSVDQHPTLWTDEDG